MSFPSQIFFIIKKMYEYQKNNNITNMCITNCVYLRDSLIVNGFSAKVKPVIALYDNPIEKIYVVCIHMVIECNGHILDPSYEIHNTNAEYFDTLGDVLPVFKGNIHSRGLNKRELVDGFIRFIDFAKRINQGELLIVDKEYYDSQADYLDKNLII
jgi:hypothetical protein